MEKRVIIQEYKIKSLDNRIKKVRVLLPKDYYETNKNYPVIYMHDGQNLIDKSYFSGFSWEILSTLDSMHELTGGMIVVGIDCDDKKRILEYSPYISNAMKKYINKTAKVPFNEIKPEADEYGDFIVNQLKPEIDNTYRTKKDKLNTYIAGSSCGGVISIYLGLKYQNIFSAIGTFSPAYRFIGKSIKEYLKDIQVENYLKIYHDMGTKESGLFSFRYVRLMQQFNKIIISKTSKSRVLMKKDIKAKHNEYYWSIRFKDFVNFIINN